MQIKVKAKGLEITNALRDYVEKKMEKIEHFFHNIQKLEIELEIDKIKETSKSQVAKATVWASGVKLHATEATNNMYASIDLIIDKLDNQIKKFHDKLIFKKRRESAKEKHKIIENIVQAEE